ncbi:hypothetical protein [Natrialba asiatica]|uniref:Uncharacterized protein n=1 Tax=Natrialba asiatica (strain ATCC 700177 / DSM 12278 / JCM 9576 / FERM P-10747 / NBRC 102637 / 172P1) TaxID=29540 RepID=M0AQ75_NATA1|nr:hypothetical protein [Natrialba asiatica]ELY99508.1 hypothetical protein C481_14783 [Natrialba asiatica DSM 12278]
MTLSITVSDRFRTAAADWGDDRLMEETDALEVKAEQALLEIEHLVAGATDVAFDVDGDTIRHEPSEELEAFLERQADAYGIDPADVLELHVDLFARAFLEDEGGSGSPPADPRPGR